jgi:hypothetical protein
MNPSFPTDSIPLGGVGFDWEMKLLRCQTSSIRWVRGRRAAILGGGAAHLMERELLVSPLGPPQP